MENFTSDAPNFQVRKEARVVFETGKEWECNLGPKECEKSLAIGCAQKLNWTQGLRP